MRAGSILERVRALFSEAEGDPSHDQIRQAISDALGELVKAKPGMPEQYAYVVDPYDDHVIFSADLDGDGDRDLYSVNYKIDSATGECEFTSTPKQVKRKTTYEDVVEDPAESKKTESLAEIELGELTLLSEGAIKADGSALMKIIRPGWGSSGHYPKAMLERDGPKVFAKGTKMYLDHPTKTEERELPERSVTRLAATLSGDARYLDEDAAPKDKAGKSLGEGLYAPATVIAGKRELLEDLAPHIGVSIRAAGHTSAKPVTIDGRTGPQIESLVAARSVDFVTEPGAGGQIVSLFESARNGSDYHRAAPTDAAHDAEEEITVTEKAADTTELAEMRKELNELREADRKRSTRESEAGILTEARAIATAEVGRVRLPGFVRERIVAEVCADPAVKDGALDREAFKKQITEAVKEEAAYLARVTGRGSIRGVGISATETTKTDEDLVKETNASLEGSFRAFGLTESQAKRAVAVRN